MVKPRLQQQYKARKVLDLRQCMLQDILQLTLTEENVEQYKLDLTAIWADFNNVVLHIENKLQTQMIWMESWKLVAARRDLWTYTWISTRLQNC